MATKLAKTLTSPKRQKRAGKVSARGAMAVATNARRTVAERVAAMAYTSSAVCNSDDDLQATLNVLRSKAEPIQVRLAALEALQAASFSVVAFESGRHDYLATLRQIVDDPDPELRQRVLGLLAREKDGSALRRLLEGLKEPKKALVPPEKALQLLGNDIHAEAYAMARAIFRKPPNDDAKREALRLLAADAKSVPLFEKVLRDKSELRELRQIAASALQALKADRLQVHARAILQDKSDYDDIKATSLTALAQFGGEDVANDKALRQSITKLKNATSAKVKQGARQFLSKYGS
jgi:hypothetical protein